MTERKYSVAEIDRMRDYLLQNTDWSGSRPAFEARIEDTLRTYMLNGTEPEELEAPSELP